MFVGIPAFDCIIFQIERERLRILQTYPSQEMNMQCRSQQGACLYSYRLLSYVESESSAELLMLRILLWGEKENNEKGRATFLLRWLGRVPSPKWWYRRDKNPGDNFRKVFRGQIEAHERNALTGVWVLADRLRLSAPSPTNHLKKLNPNLISFLLCCPVQNLGLL